MRATVATVANALWLDFNGPQTGSGSGLLFVFMLCALNPEVVNILGPRRVILEYYY